MLLNRVLPEAKKYFPDLQIKFKDESSFMKLIGKIMFFNKSFMNSFTTTIGSTIYFPSRKNLEDKKYFVFVTLFHEMVHIWDSKQNKLFKFLYLFPQILTLLLFPLLFLFSWKIILPLMILFAIPLPAYFRMKYEKRGYFISLYTLNYISKHLKQYRIIDSYKEECKQHFKNSDYYFMWIFKGLDREFDKVTEEIKKGGKPIDDEIMKIIEKLSKQIFNEY